jgi:hypothetical protein
VNPVADDLNVENSVESNSSSPITPIKNESKPDDISPVSGEINATPPQEEQHHYSNSNSGGKKGKSGYRRQLDDNGQPKKNFYNPPGKVMRHLAQQSYFDNFYGNQGQFYTLKQKYKTQMCKHFLQNGTCPLSHYC